MTTLDRKTFLWMLSKEVHDAVNRKDYYDPVYTLAYDKGRISGLAYAGLIADVITPEEHQHIYRIIGLLS